MGHDRVGALKGRLPSELERRAVSALEHLLEPELKLDSDSWKRIEESARTLRSALEDVDRGRTERQLVEDVQKAVEELERRPRALEPSASSQPGFAPDWQRIPSHVNEPVLEILDWFGETTSSGYAYAREEKGKRRIFRRKP